MNFNRLQLITPQLPADNSYYEYSHHTLQKHINLNPLLSTTFHLQHPHPQIIYHIYAPGMRHGPQITTQITMDYR